MILLLLPNPNDVTPKLLRLLLVALVLVMTLYCLSGCGNQKLIDTTYITIC